MSLREKGGGSSPRGASEEAASMNPCSRRGAGDDPSLAPTAPQLKALQLGHQSTGQRPGRVKRRRTKRELNFVKFGKNGVPGGPEQRPGCRVLQRMPPPVWGLRCASYAKSTPLPTIKRASGSMPVIITQQRLSQHMGMFNREVKSADIERLLDLQSKRETETETRDAIPGIISPIWDPHHPGQASAPDRQHGTSVPAPHTTGKGPQPTAAPAAREQGPSQSEMAVEETGDSQAEVPAPLDEEENVAPRGPEPDGANAAMRELAQELHTHLDLTSIFPGRNLISERCQMLLSTLLDRHQTLPDLSAPMVHSKRCSGTCQGGLSHPGAGQQELLLDTESSGSRSSEQGTLGKRRRGRDLLSFRNPSPVHTVIKMGEGRPIRREDLESFSTCELFGQHSLHPTAALSHHELLSGSTLNTCTIASFSPQAPGLLSRVAQCCGESWEDTWEPRTRLERVTAALKLTRKQNASERRGQGCWMPFAAGDSVCPLGLGLDIRSPAECPLTELPQYPGAQGLSPELWRMLQTQTQQPRLELHTFQPLDSGLRAMERAVSGIQTSSDVLKNIWSPNQPSQAAEVLAPCTLVCSCARYRVASRELGSEPDLLPQTSWLHRRGSHLQTSMPPREARKPRYMNGLLPVLLKPRAHCQKPVPRASVEQVRAPGYYQPWDSGAANTGTWDLPEESRFPMQGAQQIQAFQQLPMSFFPPSEALEHSHSPLPTLHRHLLEQSSPEAWVFPRMKLY